jgi:hypothetical protein
MRRRRQKSGTELAITLVFTVIILIAVFKLVLRVGNDSLAPLQKQQQNQVAPR